MAFFNDLSVCDFLPSGDGLGFLAIGWLEPGHQYGRGEVRKDFFLKLCALLQHPWQPPVPCGGIHRCGFCRFSGGGELAFGGYRYSGSSNRLLFVPDGSRVFVAPAGVPHYIDAHEYCPPAEFQQAVMNCPEMGSAKYHNAFLATPAKEWLQRLEFRSAA